jgi:hypothetical protein
MLAYKINIIIRIFLIQLLIGNRLMCAHLNARGQTLCRQGQTIVASTIQIGYEIQKDCAERTGNAAGFTTGATHLVALQVVVRLPFQGLMIAGINTRGLFAVPAKERKCSVLTNVGYAVILRMVKILAGNLAFIAGIAYF